MNILIILTEGIDKSSHLNFVVNTVLATISFIIFLVLVYVGGKIFSIIKFSNKIILAMMFILCLDILAKCAFFSMNARIYN
jgi:membrane protein DedA with SNARE-associated domain